MAEELKIKKYNEQLQEFHVSLIAIKTFGSIGAHGNKLIQEIGNMLIEKSGEKRSTFYLYQRLSMAVQRGNVASVLGTIGQQDQLNEIFNLF